MRSILAVAAVAMSAFPAAAQTPLQKCKVITDSLERLRCYDAIEEPAATSVQPPPAAAAPAPAPAHPAPAQAATPAPAEDPLIARAKASVIGQLRDPNSARFQNVKVRTVRGKQTVCGQFNAKNAAGFMTGPQPFAFDGEQAFLIIYNPGPANSTNQDAYSLAGDMANRLKAYSRLCR
jgi:hypothetical protein